MDLERQDLKGCSPASSILKHMAPREIFPQWQKQVHVASLSLCRASRLVLHRLISLLENWQQMMLGCVACLRYWGEGRGMRAESGTKQAFKQWPQKPDAPYLSPGKKYSGHDNQWQRWPQPVSMLFSHAEVAARWRLALWGSCKGGSNRVLGAPLQRNMGAGEGERSPVLGSAKPRLHMALPPGFPGPPGPIPLCEDRHTDLPDRHLPRSVWSSQEPRTPDPPFKGNYGNLVFTNFTSAVPSLALRNQRNKSVGRQEDSSRSA